VENPPLSPRKRRTITKGTLEEVTNSEENIISTEIPSKSFTTFRGDFSTYK